MKNINLLRNDIRMDFLEKYSLVKFLIVSLIIAVFIIYPNISIFSMERNYLGETKHTAHLLFFVFRYLYFTGLVWLLIIFNLRKVEKRNLLKRFLGAFLVTIIAYLIYISFSIFLSPKKEWYSGLLIFQFFVIYLLCALIGHVTHLYSEQRKKEQEIEHLKVENLQSRYNALSNQINPHFFFNSLNGLTSVIRKKNEENSLEYVNKLSDVFRYILQSDKKGLVTLGEELEFVKAFLYMMEVRFANKLVFNIHVKEEMRNLKLPVLSLLPLIENVVIHNTIDSDHHMEVNICMSLEGELSVSNPIFPKLSSPETNGTGLKNLEHRFFLLMNSHIRVVNDGNRFTVYLPLKKENNENPDS